jgi:hypothetical protein
LTNWDEFSNYKRETIKDKTIPVFQI